MNYIKNKIRKNVNEVIKSEFGLKLKTRFLSPPKIEMGDISISSAFEIGKKLKKNPRDIASLIINKIKDIKEIEEINIAGPGYINIFFKKDLYLRNIDKIFYPEKKSSEIKKVIIEHTNINPNKAAHIGHLRNAILGDTLSRILKEKGEKVEIQNYIDDTGVQVADVVYGVIYIDRKKPAELKNIKKIDYYLWDLYTKVQKENDNESIMKRKMVHHNIEQGINPEKKYAEVISLEILKTHIKTMKRINIDYNLLPRESDIINLKFWDNAFELLKEKKVIKLQKKGENKGCWVMNIFEDGENREKVIVKSNGAITYVGKDIAYHLWKFGLIKKDFYYKKFNQNSFITTSTPEKQETNMNFGSGEKVYNVIDQRQSYLQNIVKKSLNKMGFKEASKNLIHFSYEIVALSKKSADDLGFSVPKDKSFVEVSGRKGVGLKADDLIDELEKRALKEVKKRHSDISEKQSEKIAKKIASGALRYYMLKYNLNSLIVFDIDEALQFEGETGPYLQYTNVRINSLLNKYEKNFNTKIVDEIKDLPSISKLDEEEKNILWDIVIYASRLDSILTTSLNKLEPSNLAKFAFTICQKFNYIYNIYPVIKEENELKRKLRLFIIYFIHRILNQTLDILGIKKPNKM